MNLVDLLKKNIVMVPVVASVLVSGHLQVFVMLLILQIALIHQNKQIINLERDLKQAQKNIAEINTRLSSAEATWQMAENLYRQLADQVRENSYDIKDLNR
jgi:septal ring factor EnvC (AmiA/AmiB activator)